jgi:hypothetical protein
MRTRVRVLAQEIAGIERSAPYVPPKQLANRVQALLDRSGWVGWRRKSARMSAKDPAPPSAGSR